MAVDEEAEVTVVVMEAAAMEEARVVAAKEAV